MLIKILGAIDILIALSFVIIGILPKILIFILAAYVIVKSLFFLITGNAISLVDMTFGFYMIIVTNGVSYWFISLIAMTYIGQKGVISFLS